MPKKRSSVVENLFKDELENTIKSNEGLINQLHMTQKQESAEMEKLKQENMDLNEKIIEKQENWNKRE